MASDWLPAGEKVWRGFLDCVTTSYCFAAVEGITQKAAPDGEKELSPALQRWLGWFIFRAPSGAAQVFPLLGAICCDSPIRILLPAFAKGRRKTAAHGAPTKAVYICADQPVTFIFACDKSVDHTVRVGSVNAENLVNA